MPQTSFTPSNPTEIALIAARQGSTSVAEFLKVLLDSDVYVPSSTEVDEDGTGFRPLIFDRSEGTMVSVFTSAERVQKCASNLDYCLTVKCGKLIERIPKEFGVVINPGWEVGMEVSASGLQEIRRDFLPR